VVSTSRTGAPARLTLGGLHRSLLGAAGGRQQATIAVHFEQRSTLSSQTAESEDPALFVMRRFEAKFNSRGPEISDAEMVSSGMSGRPLTRVLLTKRDGAYLYSTDGVHFGALGARPDLFDLERFERRLDEVSVRDVTIEEVPGDAASVVILDADLDVASFRCLLDVFAGETAPGDEDLDLRAYSVAFTADDDVTLDYWWSLVGTDTDDDQPVSYRRTVACHVQINVGPLELIGVNVLGAREPSLPRLRHLDDVWALARSGGTGSAKPG
jgi:hypothetical protein